MRYYILHQPSNGPPFVLAEVLGDLDEEDPKWPAEEYAGESPDEQVLSWAELNATASGRQAFAAWNAGEDEPIARRWGEESDTRQREDEEEVARINRMAPQEVVNWLLSYGVPVSFLGHHLRGFYEARSRPFPPELEWTLFQRAEGEAK